MKKYIKINEEDLKIAEEFFQNDKQFDEFLINVFRYYRGKPLKIRSKNVEKFFKVYKRTMDFVINSYDFGTRSLKMDTENQSINTNTPRGVGVGVDRATRTPTPVAPPSVNNKIINNKIIKGKPEKVTQIQSTIFCEFLDKNCPTVRQLKNQLTVDQAETLFTEFGFDPVCEVLEAMENYSELLKKYKSVFLTAKNWLKSRNQKQQQQHGNKQSFTDHSKQWLEKTSKNSIFGK